LPPIRQFVYDLWIAATLSPNKQGETMRNNLVKNSFWIAIAFVCATQMSYAQGVGPTVEHPFPAGNALLNIGPDADGNLTLGGEYKQPKNVVEQEKPVFWTWYTNVGYESEYNFRGTNLTPGAAGAGFFDAEVTKWNFTLGLFGIHQFGTAKADSWSIGEGGGSAGASGGNAGLNRAGIPIPYARFPTTVQNKFDELDAFLSYKFSLGPIDITLGNIAFFISRRATTYEKDLLLVNRIWIIPYTPKVSPFPLNPTNLQRWFASGSRLRTLSPDPTLEDEVFDRLYIRLSTRKLSKYVTPQITYYQTIYSWGAEPTHDGTLFYAPVLTGFPNTPGFVRPQNPRPFNQRNEALGGYLEGRLNGHVPLTKWMDFNPYGVISVSFRDRTEPGGANPYGGHPLTGWNHVETGASLPIHLAHLGGFSSSKWAPPDADLYFTPFGAYAYHISNPPPGTDRDEWWGGARFEVTF
jgi:hypothetical protein